MQQVVVCGNGCGLRAPVLGVSGLRGRGAAAAAAAPKRVPWSVPSLAIREKQHLGQSMVGRGGVRQMTDLMLFQSSNKRQPFSTRAQAADGDVEKLVTTKTPLSSSGVGSALFPSVGLVCLASILFGYHLGVVNGALEYLAVDLGIAGNAAIQGWVVSITLVGATIGSVTGGLLADKFGRKKTFQLDAAPLILGAVLSATATGVQAMLAGRFLVGLGIGISSGVVPLYISEISPTDIRGTLGSLNQLAICIGILLALVAGLPLSGNPAWWKVMFALGVLPAAALFLGMTYAPESPRWLYQQGRKVEAENSIRRLWGKSKLEEAVGELENSNTSEESIGWAGLFSPRYRKVVAIGAGLFFAQQFSGVNAVVYFSTAVFRKAGVESDVAASALVGAANVLGTVVASSLMDKQGRKKLLTISYWGMAASMLGLSLALSWSALADYVGVLAVGGTVAYMLAFALGVGPVPGLILSEMFPSRIRAKAMSVGLVVHWVCNVVIGLYFLPIVTKYGVSAAYVGFASICLLSVIFVDKFLVETKGKSLEEIELVVSPPV